MPQVPLPLLQRRLNALGYEDADFRSESSTLCLVEKLVNDLVSAGQSAREVQNGAASTNSQLALANDKARPDKLICNMQIDCLSAVVAHAAPT